MLQSIALIGGDRRFVYLEALLREKGFQVQTLGLHEEDEKRIRPEEAEAALFPYPFSARGGCVPALNGLTIHPEDVLKGLRPNTPILAGRGLDNVKAGRWEAHGNLEERNAEISAEAAVYEAMSRLERALTDTRALVIGYGRFGRALARRLAALGAEVTVAARRAEVRMQAHQEGMRAVSIERMGENLPAQHLILNTVPAQVLDEAALRRIDAETWLLETASAPYGFDRQRADALGIRCDCLPALPARYAPISAALALRDAALEWMEEIG